MTTQVYADADVRDFSRPRKRKIFRIDDDVFEAAPALPAGLAFELLAAAQALSPGGGDAASKVGTLFDTFKKILKQESAARFGERMNSAEEPIEIRQINEVILWLLEEYGLRPRPPSSASSPDSGNPGSGTSSTDGAHSPVSTPSPSPSTAS